MEAGGIGLGGQRRAWAKEAAWAASISIFSLLIQLNKGYVGCRSALGLRTCHLLAQVRTSFHQVFFLLSKVVGKYPISSGLLSKRIAFVISHLIMRFLPIIGWGHKQTPLFFSFSFTLMINIGGERILNVFIMDMKTTSCYCPINVLLKYFFSSFLR